MPRKPQWREFIFRMPQDLRNLSSVWPNSGLHEAGYKWIIDGRNILYTNVPITELRAMARPFQVTLPDHITLEGEPELDDAGNGHFDE